MNTSQDAILDAITQHSAYLYRASSADVNKLIKLFDADAKKTLSELRDLLDDLSDAERIALSGGKYTTEKLKEIRDLFSEWQSSLAISLPNAFEVSAIALAVHESEFVAKLVGETVSISGERLFKNARSIPVTGGALLDEMFAKIKDDVRVRVEYAIRQGIADGQTNQQIIQRIRGRKDLNYQDGILQQSRSDIDRVVRTARSHVGNTTYIDTFKALGFTHLKFVATLDGRTSKTCASYDQTLWKNDDPMIRRPPLHFHCRSVLVGCDADGNLAGQRPYVADERKVKDIPKDQRTDKIGQVDANTSFGAWFKKQDASFQEEWFGPKRYQLFKDGNYSIDKFVDPVGRQYTLKELKALDEKTFKELGI